MQPTDMEHGVNGEVYSTTDLLHSKTCDEYSVRNSQPVDVTLVQFISLVVRAIEYIRWAYATVSYCHTVVEVQLCRTYM